MILKDNINKVLERGDRLDDLIGKTDDLQASVSIMLVQSELAVLLLMDLVYHNESSYPTPSKHKAVCFTVLEFNY